MIWGKAQFSLEKMLKIQPDNFNINDIWIYFLAINKQLMNYKFIDYIVNF